MVIQNWALKSNVGRHRYRACLELGIECPTKVITDASPNDIVASLNIFRRHLTPSQIAMVMTKLKEPFMKEAKFRQQEGGEKKLPLPATEAGEVAEILAKKGGIGASTMKDALLVDAHGTDEKKQEVVQGKKSVKTAAKEIREEAKKKETGFRCNCRCRLCRIVVRPGSAPDAAFPVMHKSTGAPVTATTTFPIAVNAASPAVSSMASAPGGLPTSWLARR